MEHWLGDATEFVIRNCSILATRPVWLFSSGPLGSDAKNSHAQELHTMSEPKEMAQRAREAINPRDHRIFFGGLDSRASLNSKTR